jgi:hypothetical protein
MAPARYRSPSDLAHSISSPVYHRRASPTQTEEDADRQQRTGEVWGTCNRDMMGGRSPLPSVDAYVGPLPPGSPGIEFVTDVPPDPNTRPRFARWTGPRTGVRVEGDYAIIAVRITHRYP